MNVYDENGNVLTEYDLEKGRLEERTKTIHYDEVKEVKGVTHLEEVETGHFVEVVDVYPIKAVPAHDEMDTYFVYIPYTQDELDAIEIEKNKPTSEDVLEAQVTYTAVMTDTLLDTKASTFSLMALDVYSPMYDLIKRFYAMGLYTDKHLSNFVVKGKITEEEFDELVGDDYG